MTLLSSRIRAACTRLAPLGISATAFAQIQIPNQPPAPPPILVNPPFVSFDLPQPLRVQHGMSFVDFDRDGYADLFNYDSGRTWQNDPDGMGGREWEYLSNQNEFRSFGLHYAAAFGDYNNDGLPDMANAPHTDAHPMQLLNNLGDETADEQLWVPSTALPYVGTPAVLTRSYETHCWGDLDGDGLLDLFAPAYPYNSEPFSGNLLFHNQGPPLYTFSDLTSRGFANPRQCLLFTTLGNCKDTPYRDCRPEGAHMLDLDDDGDLDVFCNGTIFLNTSDATGPRAEQLTTESGILFNADLDEGALLSDVDMDGDFDLVVNYKSACLPDDVNPNDNMFVWGNRGDGTFYDYSDIPNPRPLFIGLLGNSNPGKSYGRRNGLALSDWDGDGDPDLIGAGVFRYNRLVEDGELEFQETNTLVPPTPMLTAGFGVIAAFADWDHDGDLDTAMASFANQGYFFENTTYSLDDPASDRPYVRVRPMRRFAENVSELETEFGAIVEVTVINAASAWRRKQVVSSSAGYLNQNEYPLTFGLKGAAGTEDPIVEIAVEFPSRAGEPQVRVDKFVNAALGMIPVSALDDVDRQFDVFRNGDVRIGSNPIDDVDSTQSIVRLLAGADSVSGLALMSLTLQTPLPAPTEVTTDDQYIGIEFTTSGTAPAPSIRELIVDGRLDDDFDDCAGSGTGNIALWRVTGPNSAVLVPGSPFQGVSPEENHRTSIQVDIDLQQGETYRLVAKVESLRASTPRVILPAASGTLTVVGGFEFNTLSSCNGMSLMSAVAEPGALYLTFRHGL